MIIRRCKAPLVTGTGRNIELAAAMHLAGDGFYVIVNSASSRDACEALADAARALGVKA